MKKLLIVAITVAAIVGAILVFKRPPFEHVQPVDLNSFIRRTQVGDGYNIFEGYELIIVPMGNYFSILAPDSMVYKDQMPFLQEYSDRINKFFAELPAYKNIMSQAKTIMEDPLYETIRQPMHEIEQQAATDFSKKWLENIHKTSPLYKKFEEKRKLMSEMWVRVAPHNREFIAFKKALEKYKQECPEAQVKETAPESTDPTWGLLGTNPDEFVYILKPTDQMIETWKKEGRYDSCEQQRQECLKLHTAMDESIAADPAVKEAINEAKRAYEVYDRESNILEEQYRNLRAARERELGIEEPMMQLKQFVETKIKELQIREQLQEIRKVIPSDLLKLQKRFDALVDQAIDETEKNVQKILDERKAQKAAR